MTKQIIGSKGGSGGSSFITKPDTLRSDDSFEILFGLGSGRWKGLRDGLGSLKINKVPLENEDGTSNFNDVQVIFADGNPLENQLVTFRLGGGGSPTSVNTQLANNNTGQPGPWVSGAISTPNAQFIDLRFAVQQLFYQDTKSVRENTATVEIEMRPSGSPTWINIFSAPTSNNTQYQKDGYDYFEDGSAANYNIYLSRNMFNASGVGFAAAQSPNLKITGKTSSVFVKELRVAVPHTGNYANKTWEVRARLVEKDTIDNGDIQQRRIIALESITPIISTVIGDHPDWDGLVWMQIFGKASDQFNGFPEVEGVFDTKICQVPPASVFNAETRVYSGATWDGSYEERFTRDPAWQIKEFIEDPIHGISALQPGSTLDKWDALEASKYYSEQVPDGRGGTHPRFSANLTLTEAQDVEEMMGYLSGAFNSYMEDVGGGVWRLKVDKPETPKILFTEDNVFGEFNYSHTDVDTRFNDFRGTFLNEELDYEPDTVRVFDQPDIDENGTRFTEIALIGCTNTQEAYRRLMFRQRVSLNEYKIVSFATNRIGRYISPLDTILVADSGLNDDELVKSTSRFGSAANSSVTLLRPVRLEIGVSYKVVFTTADKKTISRTVTNPSNARGDVALLTLDSPLPANVLKDSAVALEAVGLPSNPVSYRVIAVERDEQDEDQYAITASIIDSGKWNAMDNVSADAILAQESKISIDAPTAPEDGMFDVLVYATEFDLKRALQVNWNRPGGAYLEGFFVEYRINDGSWKTLSENLKDSVIELEDPQDGTYDFKITALDRRGIKSTPLVGRYELVGSRDFIAPTHVRGTLANRPDTAPYEGFRYTVTDAVPVPVTVVWEEGTWVPESNIVTKGSDIGVEDGATVGLTDEERAALDEDLADLDDAIDVAKQEAADAAADARAEADLARTEIAATNTVLVTARQDLASEIQRAKDSEDAIIQTVTVAQGVADSAQAAVIEEIGVRAQGDQALAFRIDTTESTVGNLSSRVTDEVATLVTADEALANRALTLESKFEGTTPSPILSRITTEETTRSNADSALAGRATTLESQFSGATGSAILSRITTEETTRSNADSALSGRATTLEAKFEGTIDSPVLARIRAEETTRVNQDTALSNRINSLESSVGNGDFVTTATFNQEITTLTNATSALSNRATTLESKMEGAPSGLRTLLDNKASNLIKLDWWKRAATIPWSVSGGASNQIVSLPNSTFWDGIKLPDGSSGDIWLAEADSSGEAAGGWANQPVDTPLDPDKTYRFIVPIAALGSGTRSSYWGTRDVCSLNTTNLDGNPYFANTVLPISNRWYLFVGYIFPRNSVGKSSDGAGVWDTVTGEQVATGLNYCFHPDGRQPKHRALQYYATAGAYQGFGRPMVQVVDGTETPFMLTYESKRQASAKISLEETTRANETSALANRALTLESQFEGTTGSAVLSRITTEETTRSNADSALSGRATTLESKFTGAIGSPILTRITNEETTRSNADSALASRANTLESQFAGTTGSAVLTRITNEENTRSSETGALATRASTLEVNYGSLAGSVSTNASAIATQTGRVNAIELKYSVVLDANGYVSGFQQINNGAYSAFKIKADNFLIETSAGAKQVFSVSANKVQLGTDLHTANHRIIMNNGSVMLVHGVGFGASNNLIEWFGPSMAVSSCTKANAISYKATDGSAYFGGALSSGVLKNAAASTQTANNASVSTGTFGSNGGQRVIQIGYAYTDRQAITGACNGSGFPSATLELRRNGVFLQSYVVDGSVTCEPGFGSGEPGFWEQAIGGALTYTDNTGGSTAEYTVSLVSRSLATRPSTVTGPATIAQRVSVISIEG